jgi:hypothetical protein
MGMGGLWLDMYLFQRLIPCFSIMPQAALICSYSLYA